MTRKTPFVEPVLADSLPISSFGPSLNLNDKYVEKQRRVEATAQDDFSLVKQENGGAEVIQNKLDAIPIRRKSGRTIFRPARYENFVSYYSCLHAGPFDDNEPSCFDEAYGREE
jgi:hypothetical protein